MKKYIKDFDLCDIPKKRDFVKIPETNKKIMSDYLKKDGEPLVEKSYVEFRRIINRLNAVTGKHYRMAYVSEYLKMAWPTLTDWGTDYYLMGEWFNETIDVKKGEIIYNPKNPRIYHNKFEFGGVRKKIEFTKNEGYYYRVNDYGYPVKTTSKENLIDDKGYNGWIYWHISNDISPRPVIRWGTVEGHIDLGIYQDCPASGSWRDIGARLVDEGLSVPQNKIKNPKA